MNEIKTYTGELPQAAFSFSEDKQRTDEWFENRRGRFTGSRIKDLMTCSRASAKLEWGRAEKLLDFGETCKKYIYEKAMERKTGKVVKLQDNLNFKYGRKIEPIIHEMLLEKYPDYEIEKFGFVEIKGLEGIAGASPDDAFISRIRKGGVVYGIEAKAAMNWGTQFERVIEPVDQSQMDFWQLQTEMMALEVNTMLYVTSDPPHDVLEVLNCEDNERIKEMIGNINVRQVQASEIHQDAIRKRCLIGDAIIKEFLKGIPFHDAIRNICTNFKPV